MIRIVTRFAHYLSLVVALITSPAVAQNGQLPSASTRSAGYTCEITGEIIFSGDLKKADGQTLSGRGLASCRNDQGFTTDYPVVMKLTAESPAKEMLATSDVRATTEAFAVNRDPNEMFDRYANYSILRKKVASELVRAIQPPPVARGLASSRSIVLHGIKNKLFINLNLVGNSQAIKNLKIRHFTLEYDDHAPDLE